MIFILLILIGCSSVLKVNYFYYKGSSYENVLDSLSSCNNIDLPHISNWETATYLTNDSVINTTYMYMTQRYDSTYIFTIINDSISSYHVKFRKEWREHK